MKIVQNQPKQALELIREAERIAREIGDKVALAGVLNDQAVMFVNPGNTSKRLALHEEAETIAREAGDKAGVIKYLHNQASIYGSLRTIIQSARNVSRN